MYQVINVPDEAAYSVEQLGTKPKFWFRDASSNRNLFKFIMREAEDPPTGEDWSEKVTSELCELLGLPHAEYDLAIWKGYHGVVSRNFVPADCRLVFGNELLVRIDKGYPKERFYHVREHTLRLVLAIMKQKTIQIPMNWTAITGVQSSLDVFVGYLLLDAWIANQDRHHQNWGFIVGPKGAVHLAPTFDHASSLGWNETDKTRLERLSTKDTRRSIQSYVERANSAFFSSKSSVKPIPTFNAFTEAARSSPPAAKAWLEQLGKITQNDIENIFDQVPSDRISQAGIKFAKKILELNRKRLLASGYLK